MARAWGRERDECAGHDSFMALGWLQHTGSCSPNSSPARDAVRLINGHTVVVCPRRLAAPGRPRTVYRARGAVPRVTHSRCTNQGCALVFLWSGKSIVWRRERGEMQICCRCERQQERRRKREKKRGGWRCNSTKTQVSNLWGSEATYLL
jgi:hypothetical protein